MRKSLVVLALASIVIGGLVTPAAAAPEPHDGGSQLTNSTESPPTLSCDRRGTRGDDVIDVGRNKVVCGLAGRDRITVGYGSVVYGGSGADKIISPGGSALYGQGGEDRFCARGGASDLIFGGTRRDAANADANLDAVKEVERDLRSEACPLIMAVRTVSEGSVVQAPTDEEIGRVDLTPVTKRFVTGEAADQLWADQDLDRAEPIPLPIMEESAARRAMSQMPDSERTETSAPSAGLLACPPACEPESASPQFSIWDLGWFSRPYVGRLYLVTDTEVIGWCSGTLVSVNVVLTAAHCLYPDDLGGQAVLDVVSMAFVPSQWNGDAPYGTWFARSGTVYQEYIDNVPGGFPPLDYAFITLDPNASGVDAGSDSGTGGYYGIVTSYVSDMFSMGYPAEGLFFEQWDGNYPYYCYAPWSAYSPWSGGGTTGTWYDIAIGCTMTGGSSGGPWFTSYLGGWSYVASVNSHGYTGVTTQNMWGPYFTSATIDLLNIARGR